MSGKDLPVPSENLDRLIHEIRGQKVMLDRDLATLYGVTTGNLNKAVRRNRDRFLPTSCFSSRRKRPSL